MILGENYFMRATLQLIFNISAIGIILLFGFSSVSCIRAPFLEAPEESAQAMITFVLRMLICAVASWILLIFRRRFGLDPRRP
jgi:hypothetical protein